MRTRKASKQEKPLSNTLIILAGGSSTRLGQDKGLLELRGKPLIRHVLDAVGNIVDERIVVLSSDNQADKYARELGSKVQLVIDSLEAQTPLVGTITGLETARGQHALVLSCDAPFVSRNALSLLLDLCINKNAVIPRWPNGHIEPLQAVYHVESALGAAKNAFSEGKLNMAAMIEKISGVRYISTLVFKQFDHELRTFFNINNLLDLKRAEALLKHLGSQGTTS